MTPDEYRTKRVQLGYTQEQLAAALGVARGTVNRRESGTLTITAEAALALAALPKAKKHKRNASDFDVVPVRLDGEEWWVAVDSKGKELCQPQRSQGAARDCARKH